MLIHWSSFTRCRLLVKFVMVCVLMGFLTMLLKPHETAVVSRDVDVTLTVLADVRHSTNHSTESTSSDPVPYIPDDPAKSPVGKPADIPRKFLIEEEDFCRRQRGGGGEALQVVSFVHSSISRVRQRSDTRTTWANASAYGLGANIAVVFMVGRAKTPKEEKIIKEESSLYHDIVQGDYVDDYHLLSYKALAALGWVSRHCAHVPWTLHADDDILVDTFNLQKLTEELDKESKSQITCKFAVGPVRRQGRWQVKEEELSDKRYPPYCLGPVWLLPTQEVPKLLDASKRVNYLWVDDAYITGLLTKEANITLNNIGQKIGRVKFKKGELGKKVVWYHLQKLKRPRAWSILVKYHAGQKKKTKKV